MGRIGVPLALLVAGALVLAGCLQADSSNDPDAGENTSSGNTDADNETAGDGDSTDGNQTEPEDKECFDYNPPRPVPPDEHEVDRKGDIVCAGQFTILGPGSGDAWNVPEWEVDDWWRYEVDAVGMSECAQNEDRVDDDSETLHGLPVYTIETEKSDCDGNPDGSGPATGHRTQGHLMKFRENGYVDHQAMFPLREGKAWAYMDMDGNIVGINDVSHDPNYLHGVTGLTEAWHVEWTVERDNFQTEFKQTWGVDVRNILKEEITVTMSGSTFIFQRTLIDSSYDDGGGIPIPLPV